MCPRDQRLKWLSRRRGCHLPLADVYFFGRQLRNGRFQVFWTGARSFLRVALFAFVAGEARWCAGHLVCISLHVTAPNDSLGCRQLDRCETLNFLGNGLSSAEEFKWKAAQRSTVYRHPSRNREAR